MCSIITAVVSVANDLMKWLLEVWNDSVIRGQGHGVYPRLCGEKQGLAKLCGRRTFEIIVYKMNYWFKSKMNEWVHECVCVKDECYGFLVASVIKPQW